MLDVRWRQADLKGFAEADARGGCRPSGPDLLTVGEEPQLWAKEVLNQVYFSVAGRYHE
jgi:hypothetical protein